MIADPGPDSRLGLRANAPQFTLLVGINALVGAMVGLERAVLPLVGETEFGLGSKGAIPRLHRRLRGRPRRSPTPPARSRTGSGGDVS